MCLNHPPRSVENLSSTKPVPGAKKVGHRCSKCRSGHAVAHLDVLECNSPSPQAGQRANPLASGADFSLLLPSYLFLT